MVVELLSPEVVSGAMTEFIFFLGRFVFALFIVVVGYVVAGILSGVVKKVFETMKLEEFLKSHKVEDALGTTKIDVALVQIIKYYVILIFLADALKYVQLGTVGTLMGSVVNFAPVAFAGVLVVIIAAIIGELLREKVLEVSSKSQLAQLASKALKVIVIYVGAVVALGTMGFDVTILEQLFSIILTGGVYGIALAFALAFGLGGQDEAKDIIKKTRKKFDV
jgi:hypothetical protein